MTKGRDLLAEGDYAGAIAQFDFCVQATQGVNAGPLFLRARAFFEAEEFEAALADIKDALTYGQTVPGLNAGARDLRAQVYLELGAVDRALKDAEAAVAEARSNPLYQLTYGHALVKAGNAAAAEKAISKYIEYVGAEPEDAEQAAEAYRYRAQALAGRRLLDKALADIDRAIELDGQAHESYQTKAQIFLIDKRYVEAADVLKLAITNYEPADPDLPEPYVQGILTRASALEEAGKELQADNPEQARVFYEQGRVECESLLDELPERDEMAAAKSAAFFQLGVLHRLLGNLRDATEAFSEAIELNPGQGEAFFRRGICWYYLGEPQLALGDFEEGAAINFDSPRSNLWIGRCHVELEEYREAVKAFSDAVAVSPRYTTAYVHRGLAYLRLEEYARAIKDFDQAILISPKDGKNFYYRGLAYRLDGDDERALRSQVVAISISPELPQPYAEAAKLLSAAGRVGLAEQYQERADLLRSRRQ